MNMAFVLAVFGCVVKQVANDLRKSGRIGIKPQGLRRQLDHQRMTGGF